MSKSEPSELIEEIGAKFFPRRYKRFKDLRSYQDASEWAEKLDWRKNPYDRFLLRRELLKHLESTEVYRGRRNVFSFASHDEIAAEVDRLLDKFPDKFEILGVFGYVLGTLPWNLGFKHGHIRHSKLTQALAKFPSVENDDV